LKDGWKKHYIRFQIMREECQALPRVIADLDKTQIQLEGYRRVSGVTDNEKQTVDEAVLGVTLPPGFQREEIREFPTPKKVIRQIRDPERKRMLQRLYPEYQFLCGFVHFSPLSRTLTTLLDERQIPSRWSTTGQKDQMFQNEIIGPALAIDLISIVQSCSEFISIYLGDIELVRAASDAWKLVSEGWLLGQSIWKIRAQKLLGALS
jgi:hypothetical protein